MTPATVHIACSVHNNDPYLREFIASVQEQTHGDWALWLRDDGSTDGSAAIIAQAAAKDDRVHFVPDGTGALGITQAFAWVLERIPEDAVRIMFADADDVWLPEKIAVMLRAMEAAERLAEGPVLVHSDLVVVDQTLRTVDRSFWHYANIDTTASSLRDVVARNPVTGAATMMNAALRRVMRPIPAGAALHDWWAACVAAATGRIIAVDTPTVLYRQHGRNALGARRPSSTWDARELLSQLPVAFGRTHRVRADIAAAAKQAGALHEHLGTRLQPADADFLAAYARIPEYSLLRRKVELARLHLRRQNGWIQNAGVLLRG